MPARPVSSTPFVGQPAEGPLQPVIAALRERGRVRVVGAVGGFRGYTLAMAARGADGPVFTVAPDEASARPTLYIGWPKSQAPCHAPAERSPGDG